MVVCWFTMKHTKVVSLNARKAKSGVHSVHATRVCFIENDHTTKCSCFITYAYLNAQSIFPYVIDYATVLFRSLEVIVQFVSYWLKWFNETICYWCYPIVKKWSLWIVTASGRYDCAIRPVRLAWPWWVNFSPAYLRNGLSALTAMVPVKLKK